MCACACSSEIARARARLGKQARDVFKKRMTPEVVGDRRGLRASSVAAPDSHSSFSNVLNGSAKWRAQELVEELGRPMLSHS